MVYYERAKDLLSNLDELDGMFQHDPASISGRCGGYAGRFC
ncbi:LysR family transcriptional regulator YhjC [Klebsiella pneumoniae]|uniref:LysR family transcriptional regulator YhjC n=1 Tax=Klebsiella pneumoniae TaxID=573 RepID=A0A377URG9_KLEPN|nr:LysR family transcriptional regulator YhjC [Klebsiella pneumoniae]